MDPLLYEPQVDHLDRSTRRRRWRILFGSLLALLVLAALLWALGLFLSLNAAVDDATTGRDQLEALDNDFDLTQPLAEARASLLAAEQSFAAANDHTGDWWVRAARSLPYVGRQIESATALTEGARQAAASAAEALGEADRLLADPRPTGPEQVALLAELGSLASETVAAFDAIDLGPDSGLIGPLADTRAEVAEELAAAIADVDTVARGTTGLAEVLGGPTRYLLLIGNNAEMRAGSGSFADVGVVAFEDGRVSIEELRPARELAVDPAAVPLEGDPARLWGDFQPDTSWHWLGVTPRFDWTAEHAMRLWEAAGGTPVEGVLAVDAAALQGLLRLTGPIQIGDDTITADTVLQEVLFSQYEVLRDVDFLTFDPLEIAQRARQGAIALAIIDAVENTEFDPQELVDELTDLVEGRHLLAWSPDPDRQGLWDLLGASGTLEESSVAVGLVNEGRNQLDFWTDVSAELVPTSATDGSDISLRVDITNRAPLDAPRYVIGPNPDIDAQPGEYVGILALTLPGKATDIRLIDGPPISGDGPDGPTRVVQIPVRIPAGASESVEIRFHLPPSAEEVTIEASGRVPEVRWSVGQRSWTSGPSQVIAL